MNYIDMTVQNINDLIKAISKFPEKTAILSYIGIFLFITLPYLVLFAVIYLLYLAYNNQLGGGGGKNKSKSILSPSTRMTFYSINPFASNLPSTARPLIYSGRCDNLNFIEDSNEGDKGHCEVSQMPDKISWNIDQSQIPEYVSLPASQKTLLNPKLTINIPYTRNPEESFFVPQCDQATDASGAPVDLYIDAGMSCQLRQKSIINTNSHLQDQKNGYYLSTEELEANEASEETEE